MKFLYCFKNVRLTQRILNFLNTKMESYLHTVTVLYLHDYWVVVVTLTPSCDQHLQDDCEAFLQENGIIYNPNTSVALALQDLNNGDSAIKVMDQHHVAIVSHGNIQMSEVKHFQTHFVSALGYCPESLV